MIELNNVSMRFRRANDQINSLKEFIVKKLSGKIVYKEFEALSNVNFSIKQGEVIGLIGGNGAGKSTLLKIISGILTPSEGSVKVQGNIAPMLELGAGFDIDLTARENVFLNGAVLGYSKQYLTEKYDDIVKFSELDEFMDVPVRNFSSGMTMRLAFSIATLVQPDILIVDEILSVGDAHFQKKSSQRMHQLINGGATVILVSHSIEQIREMCSRVVWLDRGKIKMIGTTEEVCGAYNSYMREGWEEDETKRAVDLMEYKSTLYSPTFIQKYHDTYFIVDCWHHRVLYNENLDAPVENWKVLANNLRNPQSIVSDGKVYLVEDTENDAIIVYRRENGQFVRKQSIGDIGRQPHKLVYDSHNNLFYGISSSSQQVFVLKNGGDEVKVEKVVELDYLGSSYVRAINLINNKLYFVSGPAKIIAAKIEDLSFNVLEQYDVPSELIGMNDIVKIGSYYYITVYQNSVGEIAPKLIRIKDLDKLVAGGYEQLQEKLGQKGVPYYFSFIDERIFLTQIDSYSSIVSFKLVDDELNDMRVHFDIGPPREASLLRKRSH
ncbi:ABC-type polysaccharide/polyol phosphate transport system ATPase subunit [Paenibacillus sp. W4I10]|uniref:ATP-binding cassette domain-containing protein n=1 Tax=Paenibacillus sp. W4I10 TaxID=3042298 RepID=UPI0027803AA5|nr:ATP-binding cassette domain-containing protein [Paenibacillus sp. W4I10]MDQ0724081.1 ABC-type polysaccharide/polyol phosphate transport system ATPase subunit [Paenibacillus sp. W4I10]